MYAQRPFGLLAREIQRHSGLESLPLVLLSSLGRRREDLDVDVAFARHLTKPIKASQLYETLVAVLGPRSGATADQRAPSPQSDGGPAAPTP